MFSEFVKFLRVCARRLFALSLVVSLLSLGVFGAGAQAMDVAPVSANIWRGPKPKTHDDFQELRELGVRTIINLQWTEDEFIRESAVAKRYGIGVLHFPMHAFGAPSLEQVDRILAVLADPTIQPVYLHCLYGRERTGLISALYRTERMGWTKQDAFNEMKMLGFRSAFFQFEEFFWTYASRTVRRCVDLFRG